MASLLQELLGLADGAPHGRAGHGEEISFIVAYAEGFCAGIHLQGEGDAGWRGAMEPAARPCHGASLESSTGLCPGAHPWVRRFQPAALPRDLWPLGGSVPLH